LCGYLSVPSELGRVRNRASKAAAATSWSLSLMALSMVALAAVKLAQASGAHPPSSARPSTSASVIDAASIAAPEPIHRVADHDHKSRGWPRFPQHARLRAASSMAARQLRESGAIVGAGGGL
jgi:hypothetical protein